MKVENKEKCQPKNEKWLINYFNIPKIILYFLKK